MSSIEQTLFNEFADRKVPSSEFGHHTRTVARQAWIAAWNAREGEVDELRRALLTCKADLVQAAKYIRNSGNEKLADCYEAYANNAGKVLESRVACG